MQGGDSRGRRARPRRSHRRPGGAARGRRWRARAARARRAGRARPRGRATISLPDSLVGDALLVAVGVEGAGTFDAEARLERARLVVDAGVDDAAGAAGLVGGEQRFGLEHAEARVRDSGRATRGRPRDRGCRRRRPRGRTPAGEDRRRRSGGCAGVCALLDQLDDLAHDPVEVEVLGRVDAGDAGLAQALGVGGGDDAAGDDRARRRPRRAACGRPRGPARGGSRRGSRGRPRRRPPAAPTRRSPPA